MLTVTACLALFFYGHFITPNNRFLKSLHWLEGNHTDCVILYPVIFFSPCSSNSLFWQLPTFAFAYRNSVTFNLVELWKK